MFKDRICRSAQFWPRCLETGIFSRRWVRNILRVFFFFNLKSKEVIQFMTVKQGGGGTNLLFRTMGYITNVWSIKPHFRFKTPKYDQIFPCEVFLDFVGRITCKTCNTLGGGRVIIDIKTDMSIDVGVNFSEGHSFLDFDDA